MARAGCGASDAAASPVAAGSDASAAGATLHDPLAGDTEAGRPAGRRVRHTTPRIAMPIPRPINAHHTQAPPRPRAPITAAARGSSPLERMACHTAASPGRTSTTGGPGSSAAKAHGDGVSVNRRQPSAEKGSYTPLMA
jgi:hypothetical protein